MQQEQRVDLTRQPVRYSYETLSDRQVELAIAQKVGYSVCRQEDQDMYILVRPPGGSNMPGGGLYTIRGTGPKTVVDSPFHFSLYQ